MVNLLRGKEFFYFTGYRSCGEINYVINPLVENVINLPCSQKIFHSLIFFLKKIKPIISIPTFLNYRTKYYRLVNLIVIGWNYLLQLRQRDEESFVPLDDGPHRKLFRKLIPVLWTNYFRFLRRWLVYKMVQVQAYFKTRQFCLKFSQHDHVFGRI